MGLDVTGKGPEQVNKTGPSIPITRTGKIAKEGTKPAQSNPTARYAKTLAPGGKLSFLSKIAPKNAGLYAQKTAERYGQSAGDDKTDIGTG